MDSEDVLDFGATEQCYGERRGQYSLNLPQYGRDTHDDPTDRRTAEHSQDRDIRLRRPKLLGVHRELAPEERDGDGRSRHREQDGWKLSEHITSPSPHGGVRVAVQGEQGECVSFP